MMQAEFEKQWKSHGPIGYSRRVSAFINYRNGGMDEAAAVAEVEALFQKLSADPLSETERAQIERAARANAKKIEDGE